MAGVASIFVILRVITRRPGRKAAMSFGWDDFVLIAAWAFGIPKAAMDPFFMKFGLGRDIWTVPADHIDNLLRLFYFGELCYVMSVSLTKIALLAFFLRVFPSQKFQRFTWAMIGLVSLFTGAFLLVSIFQCWPINYSWLRWDNQHEGQCIDVLAAFYAHGSINMVFDLVILLMPMPQLYRLQMNYSTRRKIHIMVMFSFGAIVTVFSAVRIQSLTIWDTSTNITWDYYGAAVWSIVEIYVGIICACLPASKVFFAKIIPRWFGTENDSLPLSSMNSTRSPRMRDLPTHEIVKVRSPSNVQVWSARSGSEDTTNQVRNGRTWW